MLLQLIIVTPGATWLYGFLKAMNLLIWLSQNQSGNVKIREVFFASFFNAHKVLITEGLGKTAVFC